MKNGTAISRRTSMPENTYFGKATGQSRPLTESGQASTRQSERHRREREQHDAGDDNRRCYTHRIGIKLGRRRGGGRVKWRCRTTTRHQQAPRWDDNQARTRSAARADRRSELHDRVVGPMCVNAAERSKPKHHGLTYAA